MENKVTNISEKLTCLENISINQIISDDSLLDTLYNIRKDITTSGFMDVPDDYTFDLYYELRWDIAHNIDKITKIVNRFNSIRAKIITYIFKEINQAKKEKNKFSKDYFNEKRKKVPGRIKNKYSNYIFRYFTDSNLEELFTVILPDLSRLSVLALDKDDSELKNRVNLYYLPKLLTAYFFFEFRSTYIYSLRRINSSSAVNIGKISLLLYSGTMPSYKSSELKIHLDSLIVVIRNKIKEIVLYYESLSYKEKKAIKNQVIDKDLLIKILNLFNGKYFKQYVLNQPNLKNDGVIYYKENFKNFIEDLSKYLNYENI